MANHLLPLGKEKIETALIDLIGDDIVVVLVDSAHTPSDSDEFLGDILLANRLKISANLSSKTNALGVFDAADTNWTSVLSGHTGSYVYLVKDSGSAATSPLIVFFDTGMNLPISTNGGDIACAFNASGIFAI